MVAELGGERARIPGQASVKMRPRSLRRHPIAASAKRGGRQWRPPAAWPITGTPQNSSGGGERMPESARANLARVLAGVLDRDSGRRFKSPTLGLIRHHGVGARI